LFISAFSNNATDSSRNSSPEAQKNSEMSGPYSPSHSFIQGINAKGADRPQNRRQSMIFRIGIMLE
jgi:hypothetical protein